MLHLFRVHPSSNSTGANMDDTKPDFTNAPVTEPYARDIILEAHRRLLPHHPYSDSIIFVEIWEVPGLALHKEEGIIFYHPGIIKQISLDTLCHTLTKVLHTYAMYLTAEHQPPPGTVMH